MCCYETTDGWFKCFPVSVSSLLSRFPHSTVSLVLSVTAWISIIPFRNLCSQSESIFYQCWTFMCSNHKSVEFQRVCIVEYVHYCTVKTAKASPLEFISEFISMSSKNSAIFYEVAEKNLSVSTMLTWVWDSISDFLFTSVHKTLENLCRHNSDVSWFFDGFLSVFCTLYSLTTLTTH